MPPLPKLRSDALSELARQLRFESAEAARRQLARTEALALEVLEECGPVGSARARRAGTRAYPLEYVVFRITGLRSDRPGDRRGEVLIGEALLADLAALIERLSDAAGVTADELLETPRAGRRSEAIASGAWISGADLARRWGVDRKTVARMRRRGLIARRARVGGTGRGAAARVRVMVSERAISAFEAMGGRSGAALRRGRNIGRIDERERTRLCAAAAALRSEHGWSLWRCAQELAKESNAVGRSAQAIARVLRRHDAESDSPTFSARRPVTDRRRAVTERALRLGVRPARLKSRLSRSRGSVYRIVAAERVGLLRGLTLAGPESPLFARDDAEEVLLAPAAVRSGLGGAAPATVGQFVEAAEAQGAPDAAVEAARAVAMHLLRFRVKKWLSGLNISRVRTAEIHEAETRLLWASRLKAELVRSQLAVASRTARARLGGRDARDFPPRPVGGIGSGPQLVEALIKGMVRAAEQFDPFRGGRLAAATTIAVDRAVGSWVEGHARGGSVGGGTGTGRALPRSDSAAVADWSMAVDPWQEWLEMPSEALILARSEGRTDESAATIRGREVLQRRYGLRDAPPRTPADVASEMGTTPTRVVAIERAAIAAAVMGPRQRTRGSA